MGKEYADGYQAALDDIAAALDHGGSDEMWEWMYANAKSHNTRVIISARLRK